MLMGVRTIVSGRPEAFARLWQRAHDEEGWCTMGAKTDQVKGQVKEAAGSLIGDKDLESAGKAERRTRPKRRLATRRTRSWRSSTRSRTRPTR